MTRASRSAGSRSRRARPIAISAGPRRRRARSIWSIVCFFVPRKLRGEGMVRRLIAGAVAHAKENGATIVEAYPVAADAPSYRFMGFVPVFAEAGFTDVGMAGTRRHVMRLELRCRSLRSTRARLKRVEPITSPSHRARSPRPVRRSWRPCPCCGCGSRSRTAG